jgi:Domain of unknown function (DUF4249)
MKLKITLGILLGLLTGTICLQCSEEVKTDDNFVMEAYIFSNENVKNIKITETLPIESGDTIAPAIEDAMVILKKESQEYFLQFEKISKTYFYSGNNLQVKPNDLFKITVTNKSRTATATTVVPQPTKGLQLSDDKINIPQIQLNLSTQAQLTALFANARLTVNWDNPEDELHFIAIESLDKFDPIFPSNFPSTIVGLFRTFRFVSAPNRNHSYDIVGLSLETYGRYRVKVYRVNKEYADLFENQTQDSRDLNEPPSNVTNAFGLFSAFASDSAFFDVVRN